MSKHKLTTDRPLINQKIREARRVKNLNQREAAEKMGMLYDTYSKKERNGKITTEWILEFCAALDVPPSFFAEVFFEESKPQNGSFTFKTPTVFGDDFFKNNRKKEEPNVKPHENKKTVVVEVSHTENGIINTYRGLSKAQQKEVFNFINSLK